MEVLHPRKVIAESVFGCCGSLKKLVFWYIKSQISRIMIERTEYRKKIAESLAQFRITALLGPRQCGKTTLARTFGDEGTTYFDLEDTLDLARLESPRLTLDRLRGLVVIDEIQLRPDLFPLLRVLADRPGNPARFLILGSAAPELVKGIAESLAGRVGFVDMGGFDLQEVGSGPWEAIVTGKQIGRASCRERVLRLV